MLLVDGAELSHVRVFQEPKDEDRQFWSDIIRAVGQASPSENTVCMWKSHFSVL